MRPTVTIFIGAPLSGNEARFLHTLWNDLQGTNALILANFDTPARQIDFVVITEHYTALLELKNYSLPIRGGQNGSWQYKNAAGQIITDAKENPYQQTKAAKYALSDEMLRFQKKHPDVPPPNGASNYMQFEAYVCIYPKIHDKSQVIRGDRKAKVSSYPEVIKELKTESLASSWSMYHWERFAREHLTLTLTTLGEATDVSVADAWEKVRSYQQRLGTIITAALPALYSEDEQTGQALIEELREPRNFILVGPSGSTKTFHLHHLASSLRASDNELPLIVEAKHFKGDDFRSLVRRGTAPFFRGDPRELIAAAKRCGMRLVLLIDALNECPSPLQSLLLTGVQSFVVQYDSRVVFTAQTPAQLTGDIAATQLTLSLPSTAHKRAIYAHHAGIEPQKSLDYYCTSFTNAYDLTIAGRGHGSAHTVGSRTDLYDRYVRSCLEEHTTVATALLRHIASEMAETFSLVWSRDQFERFGEQFITEQQAPLSLLDKLRKSRLVQVTHDSFSFEHELLFDYFRAEHLRRNCKNITALACELTRPRNHDLVAFIAPRQQSGNDVAMVLATINDPNVLAAGLRGHLGVEVQRTLTSQAQTLIADAVADLHCIELTGATRTAEDGKLLLVGVEVIGNRPWTKYEALLCSMIARSIDIPSIQAKFLELLDLTTGMLRQAAQEAGAAVRIKPLRILAEVLRQCGILHGGIMQIPAYTIVNELRSIQMFPRHYKEGLPIIDALRERATREPVDPFALFLLLEDLRHVRADAATINKNLVLVQTTWSSPYAILRVDSLLLLRSMRLEIDEHAPDLLPDIRAMLESFDKSDPFTNTDLFETLAVFDALELITPVDDAIAQMHTLLQPDAEERFQEVAEAFNKQPRAILYSIAYDHLAKIFEDVYQGAYWEAYEMLASHEKRDLLTLAVQCDDHSFYLDWMMRELVKHGSEATVPVFEMFASGVRGDTMAPQQEVAAFLLGIEGCARYGGKLPPFQSDAPHAIQAWQTVSEILYLLNQGQDDILAIESLLARLSDGKELALGDVFYQLAHSWMGQGEGQFDLVQLNTPYIRHILERCIQERHALPSIFTYGGSRNPAVIRFLICSLGAIGDSTSKKVLSGLADDPEFGKEAIDAAEALHLRLHNGLSSA